MVDDTLSLSECGIKSVTKNAIINSFVENPRMTLSTVKSVVIHIGSESKCKTTCPELKVHEHTMTKATSAKYLGDVVSGRGVQETIESRVQTGWGKVSQILGLLAEVPSGPHRIKIYLVDSNI